MNPPDAPRKWLLLNVDDYEPARYAKTRVLRAAGYSVLEAARGDMALEMAEQHRPDLILLDVKLPDMSGLDVCRRLKANPDTASAMVIQNSASFVNASDQVRGLEGGADTYLTAPVDPTVLVATVAAMLRIANVERQLRDSRSQLVTLMERERAAREAAERADGMKDEFLATVSHELRTPINAVTGWAQLLKKRAPDADLLSKGLDVIERNSRLQARLIEDLLDMSRVQSGKLRLNLQQIDPIVPIESALAALQPDADAKGVNLKREFSPASELVWADSTRLHQIAWNLLANSIKFTPAGGQVRVYARASSSRFELVVIDTGVGIDASFLPHVFERFRQADSSTTRRHGGLGIGLSVVKNLVELQGGTVLAESDGLNRGATFTIKLPLCANSATAQVSNDTPPTYTQPMRPVAPIDDAVLMGAQILAVDDDPDARDILRRILEEAGAIVMTAGSAEEALAAMRMNCPDLLISDIGMPDQDGFDLIRRIRAMDIRAGGGIPAAALTAMARTEDCRRALEAGFQMHLTKPVEPSDLVDVAASLLLNARAQRP